MLTSRDLIAEARTRTGLEDLGEDSFRESLERLLDSVNREAKFTDVGAYAFREMMIQSFTNRLQIEDWYRRHPEIDDEEIIAPVFGVGLPRTGSSLLSSLQALDPETRSLRTWEASQPCPPPIKGEEMADPRIERAAARIRMFEERYPAILSMVPMGVHEPTEDFELMLNSMCCDYYYQYANCPSFMEWFHDPARDFSYGYRYHKRTLKLLQWRCPPKRWSLKMPGHDIMIEGLNKVYPDARFIMTHRDPQKVLPSIVPMVAVIREDLIQDPRTDLFSAVQIGIWEKSLKRLMDFRARHEDRFIDIYHTDLLADSVPEMERLYRWLGWPMPPDYIANLRAWRDANPKTDAKYETNFTLDMDDLRRRLAFYSDRFFPRGGSRAA